MKTPWRRPDSAAGVDVQEDATTTDPVVEPATARGKGRPTPKRRDSGPKRGPVAKAPTTRREAMQWQKQRAKTGRPSAATGPTLTAAQRRERMMAGDENYLLRRDKGAARALARDYVDSHRMFSNYLIPVAIVVLILPSILRAAPVLGEGILVIFIVLFVVEWYFTGKRLVALAAARGIEHKERPFGLGFYAGSRAYLPRRMRQPRPRVSLGDEF